MAIEDKWLEGYIDGLSKFIAFSKNETFDESMKEYQEIKRIFMEKKEELKPVAEKWKQRLREALSE
jgi:hypothetical protein